MLRERVTRGGYAGFVAAAATAGALIGFGIARGAPFQPLNTVAHMVFGTRAHLMDQFDPLVTPVALALHVTSVTVWGLVFAQLGGRLRSWRLVAAAAVFAGIAYIVDYHLVPRRFTPGFETFLSSAEIGAIYVILALALATGVSLARPRERMG
ncbi:MAG: hypothetical protein WKG32_11285 [Gemmatimonadaceae bacterium]